MTTIESIIRLQNKIKSETSVRQEILKLIRVWLDMCSVQVVQDNIHCLEPISPSATRNSKSASLKNESEKS